MQYAKINGSKMDNASAETLGGKAFGLYRLKRRGVSVPRAIVLPTHVCRDYMVKPEETMNWVRTKFIPTALLYFKKGQPDASLPLLSVRSGAEVSMPGMMDTVLNVGLDIDNVAQITKQLGEVCATDCRKRLIEMYCDVVLELKYKDFDNGCGDPDQIFWSMGQGTFPKAEKQLLDCIEAVFLSWGNERAITYRALNGISDDLGTAVTIQLMVFGNHGPDSCSGVLFTRDPSTGAPGMTGEFMVCAQGEDIVAGTATPLPLCDLAGWNKTLYLQLLKTASDIEELYKDMQDVEFTVDKGKLWVLQTRAGKRSAEAAVRIAVDLYEEGLITRSHIPSRVSLRQYLTATKPKFSKGFKEKPHGTGLAASTGVVVGRAVFSSDDAVKCTDPCILIAKETTPDDIAGMHAAVGILTSTGGFTSHAAVVARGMDKVCVVGASDLTVEEDKCYTTEQSMIMAHEGDWVSLNGSTGEFWLGTQAKLVTGTMNKHLQKLDSVIALAGTASLRTTSNPAQVNTHSGLIMAQAMIDEHGDDKFISAVASMKEGCIDLRSTQEINGDADKEHRSMFGEQVTNNDAHRMDKFLQGVQAGPEHATLEVLLPEGVPSIVLKGLQTHTNVKIIPKVETLEHVIMASGVVLLNAEALGLINTQVLDKVYKYKASVGENMEALVLGGPNTSAKTSLQDAQDFLL